MKVAWTVLITREVSASHDQFKKRRKEKGEIPSWKFLDDVPLADKTQGRGVTSCLDGDRNE